LLFPIHLTCVVRSSPVSNPVCHQFPQSFVFEETTFAFISSSFWSFLSELSYRYWALLLLLLLILFL
jgi:hypothetical protein